MTPAEPIEIEAGTTCQQPCHPDSGCEECAAYWQRMIDEGYWDADRKCWTDKGWRELTKP